MPEPKRLLLPLLVVANAALGAMLLFVRPDDRLESAATTRAAPDGSPRALHAEIATVRERLIHRLRAAAVARDDLAFRNPDQLQRIGRDATVDRIAIEYAELFAAIGLGPEQTHALRILLARREIVSTWFAALPAEIAADVPTTYSFDRDYWSARIREKFGSAILARIQTFETEIPLRQETTALATALEVARQPLSPEQHTTLESILRRHPTPDAPAKTPHGRADSTYYEQRLQRVEQVIAATETELGATQAEALAEYLFENEERFATASNARERLASLRRARTERSGSDSP